jgi:hypothetical protein
MQEFRFALRTLRATFVVTVIAVLTRRWHRRQRLNAELTRLGHIPTDLAHLRAGRHEEAVKELAAWPVDRLVATSKSAAPKLSPSDRMAVAILQAEVI